VSTSLRERHSTSSQAQRLSSGGSVGRGRPSCEPEQSRMCVQRRNRCAIGRHCAHGPQGRRQGSPRHAPTRMVDPLCPSFVARRFLPGRRGADEGCPNPKLGIEPDGTSAPAERHVTTEWISYRTLPALAARILVELSGIARPPGPAEMSCEPSRSCVRVVARHLPSLRIRILCLVTQLHATLLGLSDAGGELSCGAGRTA
jgi:hypothetical protein